MAKAQSEIYDQLKYAITGFVLRPGSRLVEDELAERYGVSRTPVRQVLHQLEQEGLVVGTPARGRFVRDISLRDYEDVSRVRLELEDLAVVQACERGSDEDISELSHTWDAEDTESGGYVYADERFHTGVARLSANAFLIDELSRVNDRIRIIRVTDFTDLTRIATVRKEHGEILEAIRDRDTPAARALMRQHIEHSQANIRELIARALEHAYLDSPADRAGAKP